MDTDGLSPLEPFGSEALRLATKEEWFAFCREERVMETPERLPARAYDQLAEPERAAYDVARRVHHATFGPIRTPGLAYVLDELWSLAETNLLSRSPNAWRAALIDGHGTLGKTTALEEFGRMYELRLRDVATVKRPEGRDEFVPVVYVSIDADATIKGFDRALAHFYALPIPHHMTRGELSLAVERITKRCRTTLFLIDDLHNLNPRHKTQRDVSSHFKHLANIIPATFVFAGIDCVRGGLLDDNRVRGERYLSQTRGRVAVYELHRYGVGRQPDLEAWRDLVSSFASELVLMRQSRDELAERRWRYLYTRSAGSIGSLSTLLRTAANRAIDRAEERLTRLIMDSVVLDAAAEESARKAGWRPVKGSRPPDPPSEP